MQTASIDVLSIFVLLASASSVSWFVVSRAYPVFGGALLERIGKLNTYGGGLLAAWLVWEARSLWDHPAVAIAGVYLLIVGLLLKGHTVIKPVDDTLDADHR